MAARPATALSSLLAVLLAGCGTAPLPEPWTPAAAGTPWHTTDADPWAVLGTGCGFCTGSPDAPEFLLVAVFRDGKVLAIDYSVGGGAPLSYAPTATPALRDDVADLLAVLGPLYGEDDRGVRVHRIHAQALSADDHARVAHVLGAALSRAREPPNGDPDCVDCGGFVLEAFAPPKRQELRINRGDQAAGPALQLAFTQMLLLDGWADPPQAA